MEMDVITYIWPTLLQDAICHVFQRCTKSNGSVFGVGTSESKLLDKYNRLVQQILFFLRGTFFLEMVFESEQVVAFFSDTGKPSWFIGKVSKYKEDTKEYELHDVDDDTDVSVVKEADVMPFPQPYAGLKIGEIVMSLWFDVSSNEWMTELYPAIVIQEIQPEGTARHIAVLRFIGDTKLTYVPVERIIRVAKQHQAAAEAVVLEAPTPTPQPMPIQATPPAPPAPAPEAPASEAITPPVEPSPTSQAQAAQAPAQPSAQFITVPAAQMPQAVLR